MKTLRAVSGCQKVKIAHVFNNRKVENIIYVYIYTRVGNKKWFFCLVLRKIGGYFFSAFHFYENRFTVIYFFFFFCLSRFQRLEISLQRNLFKEFCRKFDALQNGCFRFFRQLNRLKDIKG